MKQSEIIKLLSDRELKKQLILSQFLFLAASILLSYFLFDSLDDWLLLFEWDPKQLFIFGLLPGLLVVLFNLALEMVVPERHLDDDGINKRIFGSQSVPFIIVFSLLIALSEEMLFRGLIQTVFGYVFASLFFAFIHFRYLKKPVLLLSVLAVSFLIGYLYELTGNLLVTITAHFTVDALLGLVIRYRK